MRLAGSRIGATFRAFVLCCAWATVALANPARLVLVDPDPELERALHVALSPWGTKVLTVRTAGPGNTMPGSAERARVVAKQYEALAVVWVSNSDEGHALWMYGTRDDRVVARRLTSPPPFDDANAAAVALAIKTMLRQSDVPPPEERAAEPLTDPWLSLSLNGGIRAAPTTRGTAEPRLGMGAMIWPRFDLDAFDLGAGLEVTSGPGVAIEDPTFTGRWTETVLLAVIHGRWRTGHVFDVALEPGLGVGIAVVSGTIADPIESARFTRVNPLAQVHFGAGFRLGHVWRLGLSAGLVRPFRTQTYLVHGNPVFEAKSLTFEARLSVEAGLF